MRKKFFFVLAAAALLLMVPAQNAQAQSETPKVEIGMHYSHLRLCDFEAADHVAILMTKPRLGCCH